MCWKDLYYKLSLILKGFDVCWPSFLLERLCMFLQWSQRASSAVRNGFLCSIGQDPPVDFLAQQWHPAYPFPPMHSIKLLWKTEEPFQARIQVAQRSAENTRKEETKVATGFTLCHFCFLTSLSKDLSSCKPGLFHGACNLLTDCYLWQSFVCMIVAHFFYHKSICFQSYSLLFQ